MLQFHFITFISGTMSFVGEIRRLSPNSITTIKSLLTLCENVQFTRMRRGLPQWGQRKLSGYFTFWKLMYTVLTFYFPIRCLSSSHRNSFHKIWSDACETELHHFYLCNKTPGCLLMILLICAKPNTFLPNATI